MSILFYISFSLQVFLQNNSWRNCIPLHLLGFFCISPYMNQTNSDKYRLDNPYIPRRTYCCTSQVRMFGIIYWNYHFYIFQLYMEDTYLLRHLESKGHSGTNRIDWWNHDIFLHAHRHSFSSICQPLIPCIYRNGHDHSMCLFYNVNSRIYYHAIPIRRCYLWCTDRVHIDIETLLYQVETCAAAGTRF